MLVSEPHCFAFAPFFFTVPSVYVLKPVPALLNKESSSHEVVLVVLWSNNSLIRTPFFHMRNAILRLLQILYVGSCGAAPIKM